MPDGRVALFDYGITGRMDEPQRLAFLRMMLTGAVNDIRGQLEAFRDLGALPPDADIDALMRVLKVDQPVKDPTTHDRRRAGARDPGPAEGSAQAGRQAAEAPDALREEHDLLRRRDHAPRSGRQSLRAGDARSTATSRSITRIASCATSASIRGCWRSTSTACKRTLGLEDETASLTQRELVERRQRIQEQLEAVGERADG